MKTVIEKAKYEGYVWRSDEKAPLLYNGDVDTALTLDDEETPFIIEGNLWDSERQRSIYIRYADGRYIVRHTAVTAEDLQTERCTEKKFIAHRMKGVESLKYVQYWELCVDDLCEGMQTLRPEKTVFVGFNRKKEEE